VTNFRVSDPMPNDIAMPPALLRAAPDIGSATQRGLPALHWSCIEDHSCGVAPPSVNAARGLFVRIVRGATRPRAGCERGYH
jgi:hypothetical protein